MEHLLSHIKAARGNLTRLAAAIGVTPAAITQWEKVPAERVVEVSDATGIPRKLLRPDLFEGMEAAE